MKRISFGVLALLLFGSLPARADDKPKPIVLDAKNWNPTFVAFTTDGKTLLAWDDQGVLKAWTVATGKPDAALAKIDATGKGCAVSADGKTLLLAKQFGDGWLLDLETLKVRKASASPYNAMHYAITSDGGVLAWVNHEFNGGGMGLWDTAKNARVKPSITLPRIGSIPNERALPVLSVAIAPDGKLLATGHPHGSRGSKITVWEMSKAKEQSTILLDDEDAGLLRFSADGKTLVSASGLQFGLGNVRTWDVGTGKLTGSFGGYGKRVFAVALSNDGKWLATGDELGGKIRVHEVGKGSGHPLTLESPNRDSVACLAFSPDGKLLASVSTRERGVLLWDITKLRDQQPKK